MSDPIVWTADQLREQAGAARAIFRQNRLEEPHDTYSREFDKQKAAFERLLHQHGIDRIDTLDPADLTHIAKARLTAALRYLPGPPISADDLKTIADVNSIAAKTLSADTEASRRVLDVLKATIDPRRFPWIDEHRDPTDQERAFAVFASAVLAAGQIIATERRNQAKRRQEGEVKSTLVKLGFREVKRRDFELLHHGPGVGEFCLESKVGDTRADFVVRLHDERLLLLECKVSNSAVNSVKRVNREAAGKARSWLHDFGAKAIVPGAVLSGVFKVENLIEAQGSGLRIFWEHELGALSAFIESTQV